MSKTIWNSGDIITTEKWNKINNNNTSIIGAYRLNYTKVVETNSQTFILEKNFNEILNLINQGIICYIIYTVNENTVYIGYLLGINYEDRELVFYFPIDAPDTRFESGWRFEENNNKDMISIIQEFL